MLFTNITGKKETKGYNEALVIACPTVGEFRITPLAQKTLDLKDGDAILINVHPEDTSRVFLAKGIAGVPVRDENGAIQKDGRGRTVYAEGSALGAVVRTASEGSVNLKFTGAAGWNALGAETSKNKFYTLSEGIEGGIETGNVDEKGDKEVYETVFFELIFKEEKAKSERKSGDVPADGDEADDFDGAEEFNEEEV
jgi:hypothetical protein